jgi:catechol 2,3-dioxygenase-like lactoylglutathione lyase family enzyme
VKIESLDHLVLTVASIERSVDFYTRVLGMGVVTFAGGRKSLVFGKQKINLHQVGSEFLPCAGRPTAGSGDICFITDTPMDAVIAKLRSHAVAIEEGPVERTGAVAKLLSVYLRDPDGNLIEISNQIP